MRTLLSAFLFAAFAVTLSSQVVVTHFNAPWNKHNKADWVGELKGCEVTYVDISLNPSLCRDNKIKTVPTIIIFNNGKEVQRFQGGLSFKVRREAKESEMQEIIYRLQPYPPQYKNPTLQ